MKLTPYPKYRDSGVEWLGEVPEGWVVKPVKRIARFFTGWTPPTGRDDYYSDEHLWANISDLGPRVLDNTEKQISDAAVRESRLRLSPEGSLLFSFKLSVGQVSIAGTDMYTNEAIATFPPDNGAEVGFLYWAAPFYIPHNARENIYGAQLLNRELIRDAWIVVPPLEEQHAIAAFLDRETARIDGLVEKKRRQIELLQEQRVALIGHAVTKGLDPTTPMKDSGVEWLGEVPEGWEIWKVTHGFERLGSGMTPDSEDRSYYDGDIPWVTTSELREREIIDTADKVTVEALHDYPGMKIYQPGTLLFAMYGATIGRMGILGLSATVNQACAAFVGPKMLDAKFVFYWLWMRRATLLALAEGGGQPNLSQDILRQLRVPAPPFEEQHAITEYLDRETARIDGLLEKVDTSIDLLREHRAALISSAVTGKIDLRRQAA